MMNNRWSKITLVGALAAPLMFVSGTAMSQAVGQEATQSMPDKPLPQIAPKSEIIPGIRLSNNEQQILGVIQEVVTHGGQDYALVSVGEFTKAEPPGVIALPVDKIWIDGPEIRYDIAWDDYRQLPAYDGTAPTWMKAEKPMKEKM